MKLSEFTQEEIDDVFRELTEKGTTLILRLSKGSKSVIEQAAKESDMTMSKFIRKVIKKEIVRLYKENIK